MADSIVGVKSFDFALRIVKLYKYLCDEKKEYVLSKQLLRSRTSIGANIREALHRQSKRDFLAKLGIALKEANETLSWIELLYASEYINEKQKNAMWADNNEIISLLVSIIKTTKSNLEGISNG